MDWKAIIDKLHEQPWVSRDGQTDRRIMLGTVSELWPSGKEYFPWDMGSVVICPSCSWAAVCSADKPCLPATKEHEGEYHCESCMDGQYIDSLVRKAAERGLFVVHDGPNGQEIWIGEINTDVEKNARKLVIQ